MDGWEGRSCYKFIFIFLFFHLGHADSWDTGRIATSFKTISFHQHLLWLLRVSPKISPNSSISSSYFSGAISWNEANLTESAVTKTSNIPCFLMSLQLIKTSTSKPTIPNLIIIQYRSLEVEIWYLEFAPSENNRHTSPTSLVYRCDRYGHITCKKLYQTLCSWFCVRIHQRKQFHILAEITDLMKIFSQPFLSFVNPTMKYTSPSSNGSKGSITW